MASTRNRNLPGDYAQETRKYQQSFERMSFDHSSYFAHAQQSYLPGYGIAGAKMPARVIREDFSDVESELFGIGANDLVNPRLFPIAQMNQPVRFQHLDIVPPPSAVTNTLMPAAFAGQENQRPLWLN